MRKISRPREGFAKVFHPYDFTSAGCAARIEAEIQRFTGTVGYNSPGATILFRAGGNNIYYLERTVILPWNVSIICEPGVLFRAASGATFTSGYQFFVNTANGTDWVVAYSTVSGAVLQGIKIDSTPNPSAGLRGIKTGSKTTFIDCGGFYINKIITTLGNYIDNLRVVKSEINFQQGNEYAVELANTGDALTLQSISASRAVKLTASTGGVISGIVGGVNLISSKGVIAQGLHMEDDGQRLIIDNSSVTVDEAYLWRTATPKVLFQNSTGNVSTLRGVKFIHDHNTDNTTNSEYDMQVDDRCELVLDNVTRHTTQNGSLSVASTTGISICKGDGSALTEFNNYSHILSRSGRIGRNYVCPVDRTVSCGTGTVTLLGTFQTNTAVPWRIANGTYYYNAKLFWDPVRLAGLANSGSAQSLAVSTATGGILCAVGTLSNRLQTCVMRIYRGTSSGSYDSYVDLPLINTAFVYDDGLSVNGHLWKSRTAGAMDTHVDAGSWIEFFGPNIRMHRNATTAATTANFIANDEQIFNAVASGNRGAVCTDTGAQTWKTFGPIAT